MREGCSGLQNRTPKAHAENRPARPGDRYGRIPLKNTGLAAAQKAIVAVARKLAIVLHRMWRDEADFRWSAAEAA